MKILHQRFIHDAETTLSLVYVDGQFVCFSLEDEPREEKLAGETRIPAGVYQIKLRTEGRHHEKYKQRFDDIHRGMLWLQDVPGFTWILIHCGNTEADTDGCLLVGHVADSRPGMMRINNSTGAYRMLYKLVVDAAEANELVIEILDDGFISPQ